MGSGYVIDHCVVAFNDYCRQKAYQVYVTDGIRCMSESLANFAGGSYLENRFADIFDRDIDDERTGDEVALDIIERAGLIYGGGFYDAESEADAGFTTI